MQKQIEIEYIAQQKKDKTKILVSSTSKEKFSRDFESVQDALNFISPYKKGDLVFITCHAEQVGSYTNSVIDHISFKEPDNFVPTSKPTERKNVTIIPSKHNFDNIDIAIEEYIYTLDILSSKHIDFKDEQALNSQIATILIQAQKK